MRSPSSIEVRRARPLLGTIVAIRASGAERARLEAAVEGAFHQVARVHELMSFHSPDSDITRLNRSASTRPVPVSAETWSVLAVARQLAEVSSGLFDVTVAPALVRWGYLPRPRVPGGSRRAGAGWRDVDLLDGHAVRFRKPLLVDLGGIAKGYAVDLAVEALEHGGASRGVVNAGGDLRAFGDCGEPVHVRLPHAPERFLALTTLNNAAFATSAGYFARRSWRGRRVSPLVFPTTGRPCLRRWSVSVKAPRCVLADGLTKVLMLGGESALPTLRAFSAEGFIVTAGVAVLSSEAAGVA